jgi:hypothetical protein
MTERLDKLRKTILEGSSDSFASMHSSKITNVPYDTGKVFNSADFLQQASRPKDNAENSENFLQDLVDNIHPDDEDIMALVKKWDDEVDLDGDDLDREPWEGHKNRLGDDP